MQWPSGAPRSTWERQEQAWEHLGAPTTSFGVLATNLGAPQITVEQSGKKIIFFGNAASAPGKHSCYSSFNDCEIWCTEFVFWSMYICIYIATHLHTIYLDLLQVVLESNSRCAWRWVSSELRDVLRGLDGASLDIHLDAIMVRTWRPWSSELRDALLGHDWVSLEMHLEAVIEWVWRCTWRP